MLYQKAGHLRTVNLDLGPVECTAVAIASAVAAVVSAVAVVAVVVALPYWPGPMLYQIDYHQRALPEGH
jgi:hypothetical protein